MDLLLKKLVRLIRLLALYPRANAAERYAANHSYIGKVFDAYGRRLAWRLLARGQTVGVEYLINPVSLTRYFEFDFALRWLPSFSLALDVSSPRLFSFFVAERQPQYPIVMINPDRSDSLVSARMASVLRLNNLSVQVTDVAGLMKRPMSFDCVWSLSVIEHIAGTYDDCDAMRWLYALLKPGGRLIVTVPVDRIAWDEYRSVDYYSTQPSAGANSYFFQHFYDWDALQRRLITPTGQVPIKLEWFGEKTPGHFADYVRRWQRSGFACTVNDVREFIDNYRTYDSWEQMLGMGVCGLVIEKPALPETQREAEQ